MAMSMIRTTIAALLFTAAPSLAGAQAAEPQLNLDQRMLVRCSAAFAIIAAEQKDGDAEALRYPDLSQRGREFFVRASAQVMDTAGLDRQQIAAALSAEARQLNESGTVHDVMPVCIGLLPAE